MTSSHAQRYIDFFERLQPGSLEILGDYFADQARFVDPFNDVRGTGAIRRVLEHMFASCENPTFHVTECLENEQIVYLRWHFSFGRPAHRQHVEGVSRVLFATDGRALEHVDYWDPAGQLYEKIPLLGRLFRALRRRLSTPQNGTSGSPRLTTPPNERKWT